MSKYLNRPDVRAAVHAGDAEWVQAVYAVVDPVAAPLGGALWSPESGTVELAKMVAMLTTGFMVLIFAAQFFFSQARKFKVKTAAEVEDIRSSKPILQEILRKREQYYKIYFEIFTRDEQ